MLTWKIEINSLHIAWIIKDTKENGERFYILSTCKNQEFEHHYAYPRSALKCGQRSMLRLGVEFWESHPDEEWPSGLPGEDKFEGD